MCDSRVLLGRSEDKYGTLYVFNVSAQHTLSDAGIVNGTSAFNTVACTRLDNDTFVAFAHNSSAEVTVQRFVSWTMRLEPLARLKPLERNDDLFARILEFRGDELLVVRGKRDLFMTKFVSLRVYGRLTELQPALLTRTDHVIWSTSTFACNRLVLWDSLSQHLLVYTSDQ